LVANLVEADALIILTDQKGLYTADPRRDPAATFVHEAHAGDAKLEEMAGGAGSSLGKGGMITKILAAKRAAGSGASTVIAWGREPDALVRLSQGEAIGTLLVAQTQKQQARKQWMADHLQLRGSVTIDDGAVNKLKSDGSSLLPIGMTGVDGDFSRGEVIAITDKNGQEVARGLANYAAAEARLLCRKPSSQMPELLGYAAEPEMVHRDNMVLSK
jgi:glutamate 5-kinase